MAKKEKSVLLPALRLTDKAQKKVLNGLHSTLGVNNFSFRLANAAFDRKEYCCETEDGLPCPLRDAYRLKMDISGIALDRRYPAGVQMCLTRENGKGWGYEKFIAYPADNETDKEQIIADNEVAEEKPKTVETQETAVETSEETKEIAEETSISDIDADDVQNADDEEESLRKCVSELNLTCIAVVSPFSMFIRCSCMTAYARYKYAGQKNECTVIQTEGQPDSYIVNLGIEDCFGNPAYVSFTADKDGFISNYKALSRRTVKKLETEQQLPVKAAPINEITLDQTLMYFDEALSADTVLKHVRTRYPRLTNGTDLPNTWELKADVQMTRQFLVTYGITGCGAYNIKHGQIVYMLPYVSNNRICGVLSLLENENGEVGATLITKRTAINNIRSTAPFADIPWWLM